MESKSEPKISILTFNILAPCYKEIQEGRRTESEFPEIWEERMNKVIKFATESKPDIICLQEVWFEEKCLSIIEKNSKKYKMLKLQRIQNKMDGIAILVNSETLVIKKSWELEFVGAGNRVALGCLVSLKENEKIQFIVVTTHLAFPHDENYSKLRLEQIKKTINWMEKLDSKEIPLILTGDFNGFEDNVFEYVFSQNFLCSFKEVNNRFQTVTHFNHLSQELPVDFIFYRNYSELKEKESKENQKIKLIPIKSNVLPENINDDKFPTQKDYQLSDHRPIKSFFKFDFF
ncbi:hypothetical protein M0811_10646 [Anaeramoeba ignava]|uniref:Endonuclease/exonuclease/phosphatase domain-containing protein n=1 Tax=Anaeramoeba ignava TaxID=1746090 RepID=A0A9Q0LE16_ANAIG|nr:hypothetical protein M0811_10646 [Anaeramoeba ignava]